MEKSPGRWPSTPEPWNDTETMRSDDLNPSHSPNKTLRKENSQRPLRHELSRTRRRVQSLRVQVGRSRLALLQPRFEVRILRHHTIKLEESFLSALKGSLAPEEDDKHNILSGLFEQIKEAYEEIKFKEDRYDADEDRMASDEHALSSEENRLYAMDGTAVEFDVSPTSSLSSESARPPSVITFPSPKSPNPLHDYETNVGLAKVLREGLDNLTFERNETLQEKARLESVGKTVDSVDLKFLDTFDETFEQKVRELDKIEQNILKLEQDAISTQLLHPSATYSSTIYRVGPPTSLPQPWTSSQDTPLVHGPDTRRLRDGQAEVINHVPPTTSGNLQQAETQGQQKSGKNVSDWLSNLPRFNPFKEVLGLTENFSARDGSGMQIFQSIKNYFAPPEPRNRETPAKTASKVSAFSSIRERERLQPFVSVEPYSRPIPRSARENDNPIPSHNLEGVGGWPEQIHVPDSPADWELIPSSSELESSPNGPLGHDIWSFLNWGPIHRQAEDHPLERIRTLDGQTRQSKASHSAKLDMDAEHQESRSF